MMSFFIFSDWRFKCVPNNPTVFNRNRRGSQLCFPKDFQSPTPPDTDDRRSAGYVEEVQGVTCTEGTGQ